MTLARGARALAAALALVSIGCGGSGGAGGGGPAAVGIELSYLGAPSPRAEGFARTLAATSKVPDMPSDTWLRLAVAGTGFEPIVCQFPRRTGGSCGGIPAGSGRVVTVEEWDAPFGTLYYRGVVPGVTVEPGRTTQVKVPMRPPVVVQDPAADGALNRAAFTAIVQSEPYATITLYLGSEPVGTLTADEQGVARFLVEHGGPEVPSRPDGRPGLPDGEYLLTALAFPRAVPGGMPVRYQGAPHAFTVDLLAPALNLSAPSLTSEREVPMAGVTEPGARVRCGVDEPDEQGSVLVDSAGRFSVRFPLVGTSARLVCAARDRAGNQTVQDFVVAHLPEGFAITADMPDVTRLALQGVRVSTDPTVEDLEVDLVGEIAQATRKVIVPAQAEPGVFEIALPLFENQWNRVRVSARVQGRVLGAVERAIEHDSIPPMPPSVVGIVLPSLADSSLVEFAVDRYHVAYASIVLAEPGPGEEIELFHDDEHAVATLAPDGGTILSPRPSRLLGRTPTGIYVVPRGECFRGVYGRTVDRAGNTSLGWNMVALGFMNAFYVCVR